ncbi:hypothetical protein O0I10_003438 [Lichtheimia ornata]|uniref:Uncharacterized protein n=1 Tax=Lichtheimia ornata TaxID=688661 RepID=A0AAD7V9I2_9FUNG|nr:uncharacterized protein O0I10_003438 [Lichtheimia ornata]KAJ8660795.1 hypothetical protein O0I10_003438 [Lichtheimia ornata]
MSLAILNIPTSQDDQLLNNEHNSSLSAIQQRRRHIIKKKVIAIGRLSRQLSVLRENPELVNEIKQMNGSKLPLGTLAQGEEGLRQVLASLKCNGATQ